MKKIILIRYAESLEDVDPNMHNTDDSKIGITIKGRSQSVELAKKLTSELDDCKALKVFHSPSRRVRDTAYFVLSQVGNKKSDMSEIEHIRNLNWGDTNPQNVKVISQQRYDKGVLYFQFPNGDHTPTFVKNIGQFVAEDVLSEKNNDCVIVFTHGFALRVIAKFILNIDDEKFRYLRNPKNCFSITIRQNSEGIFVPDMPLPTINLWYRLISYYHWAFLIKPSFLLRQCIIQIIWKI